MIDEYNIAKNIFLLVFDNQREITKTFLRFQEFYESPKFKGKIFSLDDFKKWYIVDSPQGKKTGKFTYYSDWNGFNIPSSVLKPFYSGKFNPLTLREKKILKIFSKRKDKFYIIGVHRESKNIKTFLQHEIAHGLFFVDDNYRKEVLSVISKFDTKLIEEELVEKAGYHQEVLLDEIQAYSISTGQKLENTIPQLGIVLQKIYKKYSEINKVKIPDEVQ